MPTLDRNNLSSYKTLYTLTQAAKVAKCLVEDLLRYGALGQLRVCTWLPSEATVFSVETSLLPGGKREKVNLVTAMSVFCSDGSIRADGVRILYLEKSHCLEIESLGKASSSIFKSGASFDNERELLSASPYDNMLFSHEFPPHPRIFATYAIDRRFEYPNSHSIGKPQRIDLSCDNIFVAVNDLSQFLTSQIFKENNRNPTDYLSQKLADLNRASDRFWGAEGRKEKDYPPDNKKIVKHLVSDKRWKEYLAKAAASIIRPAPEVISASLNGQAENIEHTTSTLIALNQVAKELWAGIDPTDPAEHPSNEEMEKELMKLDRKLSRRRVEAGALIIRPVASKGGRVRGK